MPPTVHEVQATTGSSADVTVTAPATVQAGDLLLAHVAFDGNNMPAVTSVPVGWTLIADDDDGNTVYGGWWWKLAESGDASASWVFTGNGNSEEWIAHCVRVTGHHPGIPINAYAVSPHTGMSSGPWISPAVVTDVDNCLIIYSLARDGGSHSHTPPPGCVEIFDGVSAASGATAATKVQATAGDTGSGEFGSATVEQWIAITIAIAPEPSDDTLIPLPLTTGAPTAGTPDLSGPGMTPAPVFETDVEEDAPLDKWAYVYNTTVTTAQAVSPTHSLLFAPTTSAEAYVQQVMPGVSDQVVVRFHLRFDNLPTGYQYVWWYLIGVSYTAYIYYDAAGGHLAAWFDLGDDYISVGPVISAGQWYEIVIKMDISGTTHTLDWMVDGVAYATVECPGLEPDTFDSMYGGMGLGSPPGDGNFYIDDVAVYNDLAAYPGQAADLNAADVLLGAPALASPALSQNHALVGDGITAGAPTTGTPALSQAHALDGVNLAASAPTASAPALSQTHELAASSLTAPAPSLDSLAMGQVHALTATGVAANVPTLSAPAIGQSHALTADDAAAMPPSLAAPALSQTHELAGDDVATAAPVLSAPGVSQTHELAGNGVTAGPPELAAAAVEQTHVLTAAGLTSGTPVLGAPSLGSAATLTADNLVLGVPVVEATVLTQTHELAGDDVATGPPELGTAGISQTHALGAEGVLLGTPIPGNPVLDQVHVLVAMPLATAAPVPGRLPLVQTHELIAAGIVTGVPVPGRSRFRVVTAVFFSARMPGMAVSARAPRLTDVAARQPERAFDVEEEI